MRKKTGGAALVAMLFVMLASPASAQSSEVRLELLPASTKIGEFDGSAEVVLGLVADGVITESAIYLADGRFNRIMMYSRAGDFLASAGRPGQGPGEYVQVTAISAFDDGRLAAMDAGNRRVNLYSGGLELQADFRIPDLFSDMCILGDRMFLQGHYSGAVVHELDWRTGEVIRSFGAPPDLELDASPVLLASAMRHQSDSAIICDARRDQIVLVHRSTREVSAYGIDGSLNWSASLPGYRQVSYELTSSGALAMVPDETNSQHFLGAAAIAGPDTLLVQHGVLNFEDRAIDDGVLDAWTVDLGSGSVSTAGDTLPRLLDADGTIRIYGSNLPYPQVRVVADQQSTGR